MTPAVAPASMRHVGDLEPLELRRGPFISGSTHTVLFLGQRPLSGAAPTPPSSALFMPEISSACSGLTALLRTLSQPSNRLRHQRNSPRGRRSQRRCADRRCGCLL